MPELGARRIYAGLVRPGFRLYVVQSEGLVVDSRSVGTKASDLLFGGRTRIGQVTIPLEGRYIARRARELELSPGFVLVDAVVQPGERWDGARFTAMCVEWDSRFSAASSSAVVQLSYAELKQAKTVARGVLAGTLSLAEFHRFLDVLTAHGVFAAPARSLFGEVAPPRAHEFALALNSLFTRFSSHPDLTDLEKHLGLSSRHIRRILKDLGPWSPILGGSVRANLRRNRVWLAPSLTTARGATVERVARALGYRSPNALIVALRRSNQKTPRP